MFKYTSKFHDIAQYSNSHIFSIENDKKQLVIAKLFGITKIYNSFYIKKLQK